MANILRRTSIALNKNKAIRLNQENFSVQCSWVCTIHQTKGATLDHVLYHYSKTHAQNLVYVSLSSATGLESLLIVPKDGKGELAYSCQRW